MGTVIHRTTKEIRRSVNTPDFNPVNWVVYDRSQASKLSAFDALLATIPARHVKFDGSDNPSEMTAGEKTTEDRTTQTIELVSDAVLDADGVPSVLANAIATHTITVRKRDLSSNLVSAGTQTVRIKTDAPVPRSDSTVTLAAGEATFTLGPVVLNYRGEIKITGVDPAGNLRPGSLTVRFR